MNDQQRVRFLGGFSLGLGLAEVVAPRALARVFDIESRPWLVRSAYGLREIGVGAGLLSKPNPEPWVWARVAGDALDLVTLGTALSGRNAKRRNVVLALASVLGVTALDVWTALSLVRSGEEAA